MKVKLKIIEFSSDVFSKSSQLKDIQISPLFSNNTFNINIFDAIAKNEEYEIKTNSTVIKIGLYQGKYLLGVGSIDIQKKSQKIKITSYDNKNESNIFFNNIKNNKIQDNDYYLILECITNNKDNDKIKNSFINSNKPKRKKNASVDIKLNRSVHNNYSKYNNYDNFKKKDNKNKLNNSLKVHYYNSNSHINKNYNNDKDDINYKTDINFYNKKNKNKIRIDEKKYNDNNDINDKKDKESNEIIFNESFQKEKFSDGVLILDNDNKSNDKDLDKNNNKIKNIYKNNFNNILTKIENIEINDFENLINDFYLIYNNVNNNNSLSLDKDNFKLEYQYFLEKTSEIFNMYSKLSNKLINQNISIKNYIKSLNCKMKSLYKKQSLLKIIKQNADMNELNKNYYIEEKKYYNYGIKAIKNKLSLIKDINNDVSFLTNNSKKNKNVEIKRILEILLKNEKIIKFIKNNQKIFSGKMRINLDNLYNTKNTKNKVDGEILKNKIDKFKKQCINETVPKEIKNNNINELIKNKNKINPLSSNNKSTKNVNKRKKNKYKDNSSFTEIYSDYNKHQNYYNVFTPNNKRRKQFI